MKTGVSVQLTLARLQAQCCSDSQYTLLALAAALALVAAIALCLHSTANARMAPAPAPMTMAHINNIRSSITAMRIEPSSKFITATEPLAEGMPVEFIRGFRAGQPMMMAKAPKPAAAAAPHKAPKHAMQPETAPEQPLPMHRWPHDAMHAMAPRMHHMHPRPMMLQHHHHHRMRTQMRPAAMPPQGGSEDMIMPPPGVAAPAALAELENSFEAALAEAVLGMEELLLGEASAAATPAQELATAADPAIDLAASPAAPPAQDGEDALLEWFASSLDPTSMLPVADP
jgi:hypothetical protein